MIKDITHFNVLPPLDGQQQVTEGHEEYRNELQKECQKECEPEDSHWAFQVLYIKPLYFQEKYLNGVF